MDEKTPEEIAEERIEEARRTNAEGLDLSRLGLSRVPESLRQLSALTTLCLYRNHLISVPESLGQLSALTTLDLSRNQLTSVPESLGQLSALQQLYLNSNQLTSVPESLGRLLALRELFLYNNHLTSVPESLGQLSALTGLSLGSNWLASVPESLERLSALTTLWLNANHLTSVPESLGQLSALTTLWLNDNQLASVPESLGQLSSLTWLWLNGNRLTSVPEPLGQLSALGDLNLADNQLTSVPESLGQLSALERLYLHDNPSLGLPAEVLGPTWQDVRDKKAKPASPADILAYYFKTRREATRPLNEAKVLLVGEGAVGKTCLVNLLVHNQRCTGREKRTGGIQITRWPIADKGDGEAIQLNVWDFGGQEIMHATHQFFLTERSVYLVVVDARQGEHECRLEYWLRIVQSFGAKSPVIVVVNKADEHPMDLDCNGLRKKYEPNLVAFIETSCKTGQGAGELREAIRREVLALEQMSSRIPSSWFAVKKTIEARKADWTPYEEYEAICRDKGVREPADQERLVRFLHDLGVVLNFRDDPRLVDTNILSPEWVTAGVYAIVNSKELAAGKGVLERSRLPAILDPARYPRNKQQFIIDMMVKFELCFEFDGSAGDRWLVPELLSKDEPLLDWNEAETLNFQYHYAVLPASVMSRFIVRTHRHLNAPRPAYWRGGVILEIDGTRALVKADAEEKRMSVSVRGPKERRRETLTAIRVVLDEIHASIPRIEAQGKVPLPDNPRVVVGYAYLLKQEEMGIRSFLPDGADRQYRVAELLEGVATKRQRARERKRRVGRAVGMSANEIYIIERAGTVNTGDTDNSRRMIVGGNVSNSMINLGEISGRVSNSIGKIPAKAGKARRDGGKMKSLLTQLKGVIEGAAEEDIPEKTVADALKQVDSLAEAAQAPDQPGMIEKASTAMTVLGYMLLAFNTAATLAAQAKELIGQIRVWWNG